MVMVKAEVESKGRDKRWSWVVFGALFVVLIAMAVSSRVSTSSLFFRKAATPCHCAKVNSSYSVCLVTEKMKENSWEGMGIYLVFSLREMGFHIWFFFFFFTVFSFSFLILSLAFMFQFFELVFVI